MMTINQIKAEGFQRGWNAASWQDMPRVGETLPRHLDWIGIGTIQDKQEACEAFEMLAHDAESHGRDFSPFEYIAHAINQRHDSESAWQAFDDAITKGIRAYRRKYFPLNRKRDWN